MLMVHRECLKYAINVDVDIEYWVSIEADILVHLNLKNGTKRSHTIEKKMDMCLCESPMQMPMVCIGDIEMWHTTKWPVKRWMKLTKRRKKSNS